MIQRLVWRSRRQARCLGVTRAEQLGGNIVTNAGADSLEEGLRARIFIP